MSTNVCLLLVFVCVNKFYVFFIARGQMRKIGIHFIIYPCIEHRISFLLRTNRPMSRIDSCARPAIKFCFYICACATVVVTLEKLCSCWALDPLINNWATCLKVKNPAVRGAVGQMTSVLTSFANDYVSNSCVITSHMGVPQCLSVVLNASSHLACFVFA